MEEERIRELVAELDSCIPPEGARVFFDQSGGGPEASMKGNRSGYLRLGVQILRGAIFDPPVGSDDLPIDLSQVVEEESDVRFDSFKLTEGPPETANSKHDRRKMQDRILLFGCALFLFVMAYIWIHGFMDLVKNAPFKMP